MPKPTKKPSASWTGSNFYQKYRVAHGRRSTCAPGTPSSAYCVFPCRNPSLPCSPSRSRSPGVPRSPSGLRNPSVLRCPSGLCCPSGSHTSSVSQTPSIPCVTYVPHSIRESNSYGPRIQKYDEYINMYDDSDDSDKDLSSRKKHQNPAKGNRPTKQNELESIHQKTTRGPTAVPSKPILHHYSSDTKSKDILGNPLTTKKSVPIKKLNFILPGCKKPLKSEHMDWKDYHKLNVIYQFMDDLETNYPSICTTTTIGKSVEGRDLRILKISNSNANNEAVWIDSGIHAREWIAPAVNTYIANHITKNFDELPESVRNKDWYFLLIANPDGYHYSHNIDRMWRKNRALHNGERSGVDLNRNFCIGWGRRGSSDNPHNAFYRGTHPFSEPESSAMRDVLLNSGINFKVYMTLHCYGQIIIFPYSFTSEIAPDYIRLLEGATKMSQAIYKTNGIIYKVGVSKDVMYSASGTSNDFAHGHAGIPYCYLIELRSKKYKFKLPKEQIEETGKEILNSVLALVEFIDTYPYQDRVEQNIDSLLENDSFLDSSLIDSSETKKLSEYEKSKYSNPKKIDSSSETQGSFIRLTHYHGDSDMSREETSDTECSDSSQNVNENKHKHTSKKQTNPANTNSSTKLQYSTDYSDIEDKSYLENNYTSWKNTDPYNKVDGFLLDSVENGNETVVKKKLTTEKGTNPYKKTNEYFPDSFNNGNESVLKKKYTSEKGSNPFKKFNEYLSDSSISTGNGSVLMKYYTSEKETNSYNKINQRMPDFFYDKKDYHRNKTNTSEKGTNLSMKDNEYLPDSFNNGIESVLKKKYTSEKGTNPCMEVNEYLLDSLDNGNESVLQKKNTLEKGTNPCMEVNGYLLDSLDNGNESVLQKNFTSKKETNSSMKVNEYLPDSINNGNESVLKKKYTSEKGTNPYMEVNGYLLDSLDNGNESVLQKKNTYKKETNSSMKVNEYLPHSINNGNESNLMKNYTSEKETNKYKKVNQPLPDFFDDEKEYHQNKTNTSERETDKYKEENLYYPDSIETGNESDLLLDDERYSSKQDAVPLKKVALNAWPGPSDIGIESDLEVDNPSENEINRLKKVNEYLPDLLFTKTDLKKIGSTEKGTNLNKKINQYLSDSFNSEKESELKKIDTSRGKKETLNEGTEYLPDSFDGEKESYLNKIKASEKEVNTSEKEFLNDSDDSLHFHSDSFINQAEPIEVANDASGCCGGEPELSETNSLSDQDDSLEDWNNFYERKSNFDRMRSNLLQKIDNTFVSNDIQWYLYFDMF